MALRSVPASERLRTCVAALPLEPGMRVLEIGGGPGVAARLAAARVAPGVVVAIDRSAAAARAALVACLVPGGKVLIDGGNPLREFDLAPAGSPRP